MSKTLIPYRDLKARGITYSKPHLWRLEKAGKFPKRVPMGGNFCHRPTATAPELSQR